MTAIKKKGGLPKLTWPMVQARMNALITQRVGSQYLKAEAKLANKNKNARGGKVKTRK